MSDETVMAPTTRSGNGHGSDGGLRRHDHDTGTQRGTAQSACGHGRAGVACGDARSGHGHGRYAEHCPNGSDVSATAHGRGLNGA